MKRRATITLFGLLALVGCKNMGLDYAGTDEEGRNRAPTDLVSAVHRAAPAATQPVIVDGRRWVPAGKPITLDAAELRSVGSSAGQTVYARQWDDAPFNVLFIRAGDPTAAESAGETASPGPAGAGGTSATSARSGQVEWQPLMQVIGEDGGPPARDDHVAPQEQDAPEQQDAPEEQNAPHEPAAPEESTGR